MVAEPYSALRAKARTLSFDSSWLNAVCTLGKERFESCTHGDFPRWQAALEQLPASDGAWDLDRPAPRFGAPTESPQLLTDLLMDLHPWRKGPLEIAGVVIDTEWRSDLKWNRIAPHVELGGHRVLDIGCGNGYYGWRMLSAGAELVIGVDPTWVYVMQWLACRHFSGDLPNYVLPLGIEQLPDEAVAFDTVFSMGVLYHRRHPLSHLDRIRRLLRPGGTLVLETLVLPDDQSMSVLEPPGRYARMRNVWAVPGGDRLLEWVCEAGFAGAEIVDVNQTSLEEQRATPWMRFESLEKAIDPGDRERTIEGHPRPRRALLIAQAGRS